MPYQRTYDRDTTPSSGPMCQHLRSKAMYVAGEMQPDELQTSSSGHCWCNQTQNVFGPDSQLVGRTVCSSGRTCYQAIL